MKTLIQSISGISLSFFLAGSASAQAINYGTLEDLFGEPVTMSATGKPQKASNVPADMEILTQDDIRRSGADNIPDVLRFVTGIDFRRSSFNDGEVGIRGYDQSANPRLLVLLDGRPLYEDFYGDVVWAAIPVQLDEIRQIEIVKGPNSALFGFNAASGVINIITYDPIFDSNNAQTVRTGSQALKEASTVNTFHVADNLGVRLSAGGMWANEYSAANLSPLSTAANQKPTNGNLSMKARWQIDTATQLSVAADYASAVRNFSFQSYSEDDRTTTIRTELERNTDFGVLDLDIYHTHWTINYVGAFGISAVNAVTDVQLSDLVKLGTDHTIRAAFEYKNNAASGEFFAGNEVHFSTYSLSGMWNWQISPSVSLTNALREDHLVLGMNGTLPAATGLTMADYNKTIDATSFNSGLVYDITDNDVARALASRGFQLPSLSALATDSGQVGGFLLLGQPALRPTSVLNFELDYDHTFPGTEITLRNAIYWQKNDNLMVSAGYVIYPLAGGFASQGLNIGSSTERGLELSLKQKNTKGFRWNLGYKFAVVSDHLLPGLPMTSATDYASGTPKHTIDFGLGYAWDRLELDAQGRWQSRITDFFFDPVTGSYQADALSDYVTMTAHAGYQVSDQLSLGFSAEQFDAAHITQAAESVIDRRFIISATFSY